MSKLVLIMALCLLNPSIVQAFTFKIATLSPDGSVWMQKMRAGAQVIQSQTANRVKFKFYPGGVMGADKNVLRKMRLGQLQGAAMPAAGLARLSPDIQLYNLMLKFKSFDEVDFIRQKMDDSLEKGLDNHGLISFGFAEMGFAYVMSTNPVRNIADLRQQKVWVPASNQIGLLAFESANISPIPLPLRDVLMGLQTGMINAVAGTPTGAIALQWHTKVKYIADFPLSYVFGTLVFDKKSFNKISAADQKIVRDTLTQVTHEVDTLSRLDNISAIKALKNQGIQFVKISEPAINELNRIMNIANQKIIQKTALSVDLVQSLNQLLAEFRMQNSVNP